MRGYIPPQDTQESIFVKRADLLLKKAEAYNYIQYSTFLDLRQQELFKAQSNRYPNINVAFECGYDIGGERSIAAVCPFDCNTPKGELPIVVLSSKIYDSSLTHRDFLGAIMGLKISRDYIGDILVGGEYAYLIVHSNVAQIISDELRQVKNSNVSFAEHNGSISYVEDVRNLKSSTVASMRVDAIIAALLQVSRSDAVKLIKQNKISVNHLAVDSGDFEMFDKDIISVKQTGKYKIFCDGNRSHKDRIFINFIKY